MFSSEVSEGRGEKQSGAREEVKRVEESSEEEGSCLTPTAENLALEIGDAENENSTEKVSSTLSSSANLPIPISVIKSDQSLHESKMDRVIEKEEEKRDSPAVATLLTHPLHGTMHDLPDLSDEKLRHDFDLDVSNVDVTCMDISCHGCHVLVGCSNGMVLLFNMASNSQKGVVLGQIKAKGLHTNLLLAVKIADDARFAFAGVMKGSMEMLAIDMGKVPVWPEKIRKSNASLKDIITVHSHSDPKLRGLGAAVRVVDGSSDIFQYRLVCGKGIKNVHVWSFFPDCVEGPRWTCLYDVASNGNTIETMAFRHCGDEILSKSSHMGVRLWRMNNEDTSNATVAATGKLAFEDVPNTQDARVMLEDYVFGGTYNFAVIKIGASKALNRNEFEVPERTTEDDNGHRRKRQMRLIEDVISTQDGRQALALCSDGGVLYFRNDYIDLGNQTGAVEEANDISSSTSSVCSLIEFNLLQRNPSEGPWTVRRVGKRGAVVLLRSQILESEGGYKTNISVDLLSTVANGEVSDTRLPIESKQWNVCGYYHEKDTSMEVEEAINISTSKASNRKKSPKMVTPASAIITARNGSNNRNKNISPADNLMQIADSSVGTPIQKDASDSRKINISRSRTDSSIENRKRKAPANNSIHIESNDNNQIKPSPSTWTFIEKPEKPLETQYFTIPPIKRIPFVNESFDVMPPKEQKGHQGNENFFRMKQKFMTYWLDSVESMALMVDSLGEWAVNSRCILTIQQIMAEQDRIMRQFVNDIARSLDNCMSNYLKDRSFEKFVQEARMKQQKIIRDFGSGVNSSIQVRQLELASAVACDRMNSCEGNIRHLLLEIGKQSGVVEVQTSIEDFVLGPNIVFKHRDMFESARKFLTEIEQVIIIAESGSLS